MLRVGRCQDIDEQDPFDRGRQSSVGEPEHRGDERSEAALSGGLPHSSPTSCPLFLSPKFPRIVALSLQAGLPPAGQTPVGGNGELQLLRAEGLYSSHLGTWRQQREAGLMPKTRGRKPTAVDPQLKKLEQRTVG